MRSQNKLDLLKQEMENRSQIPNPDGVWNEVEGRLRWRNLKNKLIGISLLLMVLFTAVFLFFNTKEPSFVSTDSGFNTSSPSLIVETDSSTQGPKNNDRSFDHQENKPSIVKESTDSDQTHTFTESKKTGKSNQTFTEKIHIEKVLEKLSKTDNLDNGQGAGANESNSQDSKENLALIDPEANVEPNDQDFKDKVEKSIEDSWLQADSTIETVKDKEVDEVVVKKNDNSEGKDSNAYKKKFVIRPNIGLLFNQLKPFSIPGKSVFYGLTSNFSAGLALDYSIKENSVLSFNIGFMRMPCKIEYLDNGSSSLPKDIVKVFSGNYKTVGFDYSYKFPGKNFGLNIGQRLAFSGKKFNYLVDNRKGELIFKKQAELPESIRINYFQKMDFLVNFGINYKINHFGFKLNYYQGLMDVSKATKLFNPHSFIELNCSYDLLRF